MGCRCYPLWSLAVRSLTKPAMSFNLINPWMLLGLAGLALPVLAHLLSKKKYDVVNWGAMQFLEMGRNTRRKIRLEELLLMLLRMGLIALIAIALARPWASGGMLSSFVSTQARDVVIVIDGSYSMGWEGKAETPHAAAVQWAHDFLETLQPGDSVALLDARDRVRPVIESPTRDFRIVRDALNGLPPPSGTSNLADATARAVQILSRTSNLSREVVVLTDGQARCWRAEDDNLWTRFDDLRKQPTVKPRVWVVDVAQQKSADRTNFGVETLQLSRELTAVDFPVRVTTKVVYSGGKTTATRRVYLEVDGQRIDEKTLSVQLQPGSEGRGERSVEFEYRFASAGSHVIGVTLDDDDLPGDNRSEAAVVVTAALPVLLVDGDPRVEPGQSESHFMRLALTPDANANPLVRATVVKWNEFQPSDLKGAQVVALMNVPRLTDGQVEAISDFVASGGGLFCVLGDKVDKAAYAGNLHAAGNGLLPALPVSIEDDTAEELQGVRVQGASLETSWLKRFRSDRGGDFTKSRFAHWWKTQPVESADEKSGNEDGDDANALFGDDDTQTGLPTASPPLVVARLTTNDPLLVERNYGRGRVLLMTSPVDATDWNTLPAKQDFVVLLHEVVFHLASGRSTRNVDVGLPLVLPVAVDLDSKRYAFFGPSHTVFEAERAGDIEHPAVRLGDTRLPGLYDFRERGDNDEPKRGSSHEYFVVDFDRGESDLNPLEETQRSTLSGDERMTFVATLADLKSKMFTDASQTEFWHLLLLVFLGILIGEVVMTRQLVKGGHMLDEETGEEIASSSDEEDVFVGDDALGREELVR